MVSDGKHTAGGLLSAQKLLGYKVENLQGESLGRIEDIVISAEGGQVSYAVLSFGGVLSLWNKLFAFPWAALNVDRPRKTVILDLDRKTLAKARGFEKGQWPDLSDWNWGNRPAAAPAAAEPAAVSETPVTRGEARRQEAPALISASPAIEVAPPSKNQIDHWGETWKGHGLDRP